MVCLAIARVAQVGEQPFKRPLVRAQLRVALVCILQLGVDKGNELGAFSLVGDAFDDIRGFDDQSVFEASMLTEPALVAQIGVELLVVDVPTVAALVRVVAAMLADAMLIRHSARAAGTLQLLGLRALLMKSRVLDE